MRFTIITPTSNSKETISDTLKSISSQTINDYEHIIIDNASNDGTLDIIKNYKKDKNNIIVISEKDAGLYDAMNKGIEKAKGQIISILNSDDVYYSNTILEKVNEIFDKNNIDVLYGDIVFVDRKDIKKEKRLWKSSIFKKTKINSGFTPPHPSLFIKKNIYNKIGLFNLKYKIASDYDFMLRLMKSDGISFFYLPEIIIKMRELGISGKNLKNRIKGWSEIKQIWKNSGQKCGNFYLFRRITSKIPQYLHLVFKYLKN